MNRDKRRRTPARTLAALAAATVVAAGTQVVTQNAAAAADSPTCTATTCTVLPHRWARKVLDPETCMGVQVRERIQYPASMTGRGTIRPLAGGEFGYGYTGPGTRPTSVSLAGTIRAQKYEACGSEPEFALLAQRIEQFDTILLTDMGSVSANWTGTTLGARQTISGNQVSLYKASGFYAEKVAFTSQLDFTVVAGSTLIHDVFTRFTYDGLGVYTVNVHNEQPIRR
ncbi:hypothetical protein ACTMSW_08735 [Micromonospora sp. BQ11]|uniref:hypothetical protein n=1 Tax=Micromonospora sp. BQ11 TaxID=3452212 RepID=UPI003F89837A